MLFLTIKHGNKVQVETLYDILYECIEENVDIQNVYSKV